MELVSASRSNDFKVQGLIELAGDVRVESKFYDYFAICRYNPSVDSMIEILNLIYSL